MTSYQLHPEIESVFSLKPFFDLSHDLLCVAGYDGYFRRINPAVTELLGYSYEELFARPISDFIYEEDRNLTSMHRAEILNGTPLLNYENRYVTKSGKIVWLSWTSMPLASKQLVYAIAKNITHKKKEEEERNAMLAELSKINEELLQLNYTTSHDLRSPVHNLLSISELLDVSKIQDEETVEFINWMKLATEDLKKTLNKYVDQLSAKINMNASPEKCSFYEIMQNIMRSVNALIRDSGTQFNIDFNDFAYIEFNKAHLESVFLNLITNSIKYARPGIPPVISISSRLVNGARQLIFADNGLGFDTEKIKDKIFRKHQKFHYHPDSKGIGLYLVYNHVTSLGGKIELESKPNEGAKFIITFGD